VLPDIIPEDFEVGSVVVKIRIRFNPLPFALRSADASPRLTPIFCPGKTFTERMLDNTRAYPLALFPVERKDGVDTEFVSLSEVKAKVEDDCTGLPQLVAVGCFITLVLVKAFIVFPRRAEALETIVVKFCWS